MVITKHVRGFFQFIREQGVVGLAIGFILGSGINKVVGSLVNDVIQPGVGLVFGSVNGLTAAHYRSIMYGNFLVALIDFAILAAVVYFGFRGFGLDKLDAKKEEEKK